MADPASPQTQEEEEFTTPWHFKLLLLAVVLYLVWRAVQLLIWTYGKLF